MRLIRESKLIEGCGEISKGASRIIGIHLYFLNGSAERNYSLALSKRNYREVEQLFRQSALIYNRIN